MKYALVNDKYQEAQPGLVGKCKSCGDSTIAKCGKIKIWHWSHQGKKMCDPWWENETEWHRSWKGQFPPECQEVIHYAENGEKHIADVKIDPGYVIEFQHSHIKPEERQARENFYKNNLIWIVDGTRRLTDKGKFIDVLKCSYRVNGKDDMLKLPTDFRRCALLRDWGSSNAPVFFDFNEDTLWFLMPKMIVDTPKKIFEIGFYVFKIERNVLVTSLYPENQNNSFLKLWENWHKLIKNHEIQYLK